MSLGWQTESALVPKTAKPIKVDDHGKSMMGLRAVIFSKESTLNKYESENKASEIRKKMVIAKAQEKEKKKMNKLAEGTATKTQEDVAYEKLQAKAQLYDKLKSQQSDDDIGIRKLIDNSLVDFNAEKGNGCFVSAIQSNSSSNDCIPLNDTPSHVQNSKNSTFNQVPLYPNESVPSTSFSPQSGKNESHSHNHTIDSSSRVKSQWERNAHAKQHLESVHISVEHMREQRKRTFHASSSHETSQGSAENNLGQEIHKNDNGFKFAKDKRREMILKKQKQYQDI